MDCAGGGMSEATADEDMESASKERAVARARLASQFGIKAAFLRVNDLAAMLSISGNAVRCQIRDGRFPMPHRRIDNVVVVRFDDFVDWYCAAPPPSGAAESGEPGDAAPEPEIDASPPPSEFSFEQASADTSAMETADQRVVRIKREIKEAKARSSHQAKAKRCGRA